MYRPNFILEKVEGVCAETATDQEIPCLSSGVVAAMNEKQENERGISMESNQVRDGILTSGTWMLPTLP